MRTVTHFLVIASLAALAFLAPPSVSSQAPAQKPPARRAPGTRSTPARAALDPALLRPASLSAKAPESFQVKFTTTQGDFIVTVHRDWAPLGADRFYNLVKHHFYDNASFFRVLPGFVVQFGIPARPDISRVWSKAAIKDEPVKQGNKKGYLTYAMGGPNTRTTQVFINLADNSRLDAMGFSAFGEVTEGMDIVEKFYSGYGEGAPNGSGPRQDLIEAEGKTYLDKSFPKLDSIKTAALIGDSSAAPISRTRAPGNAPAKAPARKRAVQPPAQQPN